ncbi:hypothetical protein LX32DRAFT_647073 [Colletotrichum zoysiae]|uniref:Uncharacterized protein n=1 Tax=Colletotrichum zoysiae TaxID=1216348 RepID=A0AAD9H3S5_9PEZI|nr:hypothetical protein LX32DRAFT_647073 [Colletotrichum zoysiae]
MESHCPRNKASSTIEEFRAVCFLTCICTTLFVKGLELSYGSRRRLPEIVGKPWSSSRLRICLRSSRNVTLIRPLRANGIDSAQALPQSTRHSTSWYRGQKPSSALINSTELGCLQAAHLGVKPYYVLVRGFSHPCQRNKPTDEEHESCCMLKLSNPNNTLLIAWPVWVPHAVRSV